MKQQATVKVISDTKPRTTTINQPHKTAAIALTQIFTMHFTTPIYTICRDM